MTSTELKPYALNAVKRASEKWSAVKFSEVKAEMIDCDDRELDRALQALRRDKAVEYLGKRDPKTGKPRKSWGWQPVSKPASTKRGAR